MASPSEAFDMENCPKESTRLVAAMTRTAPPMAREPMAVPELELLLSFEESSPALEIDDIEG